MSNTKVSSEQIIDDVALGGNPTTTTQSAGNNTTRVATTAFVTTAVSNLVDSAPSSLDTLNELAAAMNDNASFFSTVLPLSGGTMTGDLILGDSVQIEIGSASGGDLRIFHDGSNSFIDDAGTGILRVRGSEIQLQKVATTEIMIKAVADGQVELYYDNSAKLATFSGGIDVSGVIYNGGGTAQAVGIGASMGDVNAVELGAGYLSLARDDTADAKQILFEKNDVEHSSITTKASSLDIASAQAIILDSAGYITLDTDGGEIQFKDGGTTFGNIAKSSNDMRINQGIQDGDIVFRGNDGGSIITALTIDMSAAGAATFNSNVTATGFSAASGGALVARVGRSLTGNDLANVNFYDADAATFPGHVHVVANSSQADDSYQSGEIRFWHFNGSAYNSIAAFNKHGGLAFGTDQAAANTLDDYEEGAFSYDIFGITATTKTFRGIYTKIGDLVSIQGLVIISGKTGGSGNPYLPLPFVPDNTNLGTSYLGAIPQVNTVSSSIVYFGLYGNAAQLYGNNVSAGYIGHGSWGNGLIGLNFTYSV